MIKNTSLFGKSSNCVVWPVKPCKHAKYTMPARIKIKFSMYVCHKNVKRGTEFGGYRLIFDLIIVKKLMYFSHFGTFACKHDKPTTPSRIEFIIRVHVRFNEVKNRVDFYRFLPSSSVKNV